MYCDRRVLLVLSATLSALSVPPTHAGEARVAVAANFTEPAKEIASAFEAAKGHKIVLSFGSTGHIYAQITQGAPFDVFLAADQAAPKKAIDAGLARADTRYTYAIGRLALYSRSDDLVQGEKTLREGNFAKVAIANPVTAPYGTAAVAAMKALGVHDALRARIVQGNNIAQALQFVDSGNAEIGFVALSQIARTERGSRWIVPATLHPPIAQDAVLLTAGATNEAARSFLAFLRGSQARNLIEKFGYGSAK